MDAFGGNGCAPADTSLRKNGHTEIDRSHAHREAGCDSARWNALAYSYSVAAVAAQIELANLPSP